MNRRDDAAQAQLIEDGQSSPSMYRFLTVDSLDEACRVRLWVEQLSDGGFWETETSQNNNKVNRSGALDAVNLPAVGAAAAAAAAVATGGSLPAARKRAPRLGVRGKENATTITTFAGVNLVCTADKPPPWRQMPSLPRIRGQNMSSSSDPNDDSWIASLGEPALNGDASMDSLIILSGQAGGDNDTAAAAGAEILEVEATGASDGREESSVTFPSPSRAGSGNSSPREDRILVFLKTLGLKKGEEEEGGCSAAGSRRGGRSGGGGGGNGVVCRGGISNGGGKYQPDYLTHVVMQSGSPLRSLFELTAWLLGNGTEPEELGAYVEELPFACQNAAKRSSAGSRMVRACRRGRGHCIYLLW